MNQGSLELGGGFTSKGRRYGIGYAASCEAWAFCIDPEALGINEVWWSFWLLLGGRIIHVGICTLLYIGKGIDDRIL